MNFFISIANKIPVIVLLILSGLSVVLGDFLAKHWSLDPKKSVFIIALVAYSLSGVFYLPTLLRDNLIVTCTIYTTITIVGYILLGIFVYHESLSFLQAIGVSLGIISALTLALTL